MGQNHTNHIEELERHFLEGDLRDYNDDEEPAN